MTRSEIPATYADLAGRQLRRIRRLSTQPSGRAAAAGVYHHLHWGTPMTYLWLRPRAMPVWGDAQRPICSTPAHLGAERRRHQARQYLTSSSSLAWDDDAFRIGAVSAPARVRGEISVRRRRMRLPRDAALPLAFSQARVHGLQRHYPTTAPRQTEYDMLDFGDENERRLNALAIWSTRGGHRRPLKDRQTRSSSWCAIR